MRPIQTIAYDGRISNDLLANIHLATGQEDIKAQNFIDYINIYNQQNDSEIKYFTGLITKDQTSKDNLLPYIQHQDKDFQNYMPFDYLVAKLSEDEIKQLKKYGFTVNNNYNNKIDEITKSKLGQIIDLSKINLLVQNYQNSDIKFSDIVLNTIDKFNQISKDNNNNPYILVIQSSVPSDAIKEENKEKLILELTEIDQIIKEIQNNEQKILLVSTAEVGGFNIPDDYSRIREQNISFPDQSQWSLQTEQYIDNVKQILKYIDYSINSQSNSMEQVVFAAQNLEPQQIKVVNNVTDVNKFIKSLISSQEYNNEDYNIKLQDRWWYNQSDKEINIGIIVIICIVLVVCLGAVVYVIYSIAKAKNSIQSNHEILL